MYIAVVVARFVFENWSEPAAFELVDGLDGNHFVLADQCEEFGVCLEVLLNEVLADLIGAGCLGGLGLGQRPLHVLGLDVNVDGSIELLVQVDLRDVIEFGGERWQLFARVDIRQIVYPLLDLLPAAGQDVVIDRPLL